MIISKTRNEDKREAKRRKYINEEEKKKAREKENRTAVLRHISLAVSIAYIRNVRIYCLAIYFAACCRLLLTRIHISHYT